MNIFQAAILGLVQGIAEFLPISSSGHLVLIPQLFGWQEQSLVFDVATHLATLCAIIWVLREDIQHILQGLFSKKHDREGVLGWKIVMATLPIVFVGFLINDAFLDSLRNPVVIAIMLIVWGIILWIADEVQKRRKKSVAEPARISWKQAIAIGCAQVFALVPGTSRSGSTISAGLFAGLNRETAARFSFLLSIPAIAGAGMLVFIDVIESGEAISVFPILVGFVTAFVSGVIAMNTLLFLVQKISYGWFAVYRIILGIIVLILFL